MESDGRKERLRGSIHPYTVMLSSGGRFGFASIQKEGRESLGNWTF